jgi:hypothetical protein
MDLNQDADELTVVLQTRDKALVASAQSFLDGAGIEFIVRNEFGHDIWPGGELGGAQILVRSEDAEAAQAMLEPLTENETAPFAVGPSDMSETDVSPDEPVTMEKLWYAAPRPEQPFGLRLLFVLAVILIPIILAILYSIQNR